MILNEFDAYQEALKKINLNEEVMPIYKGRILTENVDIYCKIQKLLGCNAFEGAHRWLYDLDVENLDESECSKVCNLYQLGIDKGLIADDPEDSENTDSLETPDNIPTDIPAVADPTPVPPPAPAKTTEAPMAAYTVVYSATRDGQIKTGEAYSNSLNTRSAKADVISKLEKAGYQNISILAIEAGDPDMSGCDNTFCKQSDYVPPAYEDEEEKVEEADDREPLAHGLDAAGVKASTANTAAQDAVEMSVKEKDDEKIDEMWHARPGRYDYRGRYEPTAADMAAWSNTHDHAFMLKRDDAKAKEAVKKAFAEANKEVGDSITPVEIKKMLDDTRREIVATRNIIAKTGDKNAVANYDKIISFLDDYSAGRISEDDVNEANKPSTGIGTLARGLVKILLTLFKLTSLGIGLGGKLIVWITNLLATGADKLNGMLKDSEDQVNEDGEEEESSDEDTEKDDEKSEDEGDKADSEEDKSEDKSDDKDVKDDSSDDKKEEDTEEPDEKLKDDKKEEDGKEDATDDKEEKDLSAQEKTQLKDSYKKAFKAAMQKCKYLEKSFDDLTLEEKVKFFETINDAWGNKADPSKFMTDKETEQLQKIVIKK